MGSLRVIIFNVEHGFCGFVKSSTGRTLLIDCGNTAKFSPIKYIVGNEMGGSAETQYTFTQCIFTHPHGDHLDDIDMLKKYPPAIIMRQKDYDWGKVTEVNSESGKKRVAAYKPWQETYSGPAPAVDWGFDLSYSNYLTPAQAKALDETKMVNNSSIPVVVTFKGTLFKQKFLFSGDLEVKGWQALLARPSFREAIKDTDFFITSHHGHSSGYCKEIFEAIGKPKINIVSAHAGDDNIESAYGKDNAIGIYLNGDTSTERRYRLTTRNDGSIIIEITSEGKYWVTTENFPNNVNLNTLADLLGL